jgi:molybdopterin/thiamine biosynthesis adenylyltransferase
MGDILQSDTRYSRQIWIPRFGEVSQNALQRSSIVVIGAGGVKSPMLLYLAAAGVGRIKIIDFDTVELSNLNRQILYSMSDVGKFKAKIAAGRLHDLNPEIDVEGVVARLDEDNFDEHTRGVDLVVEGGDNSAGRKWFNENAVSRRLTFIHASAQFNYAYVMTVVPSVSACFECLFSDLPDSHGGPVPIIGTAAGVAGSVAASEAISILSGKGPTLDKSIFFFDGWTNSAMHLPNPGHPDCRVCGPNRGHLPLMTL